MSLRWQRVLPSLVAGALDKQVVCSTACILFFPWASARFAGTSKGCLRSAWASSIGIRRKCRSKAHSNSFALSTPPFSFVGFVSGRSPAFLRKCLFSLCSPFSRMLNFVRRFKKGRVKQLRGYKVSPPWQCPDPPACKLSAAHGFKMMML